MSIELHMKFTWFSHEIYLTLIAYGQLMWISHEGSIHTNFMWTLTQNLFAQFRWKPCEICVKIMWNNFACVEIIATVHTKFCSNQSSSFEGEELCILMTILPSDGNNQRPIIKGLCKKAHISLSQVSLKGLKNGLKVKNIKPYHGNCKTK